MPSDPTAPDPSGELRVLGALALELAPGNGDAGAPLDQARAGELAGRMAHDLAAIAPGASQLELVAVGAHYDPVELLRPGFPLHRELDQLAARAPRTAGASGDVGRVVAFGAHAGTLPGVLAPDPEFAGGPLRLLPFVLRGPAGPVARVGDALERELLERGMADAATALLAQDAFGLRIEHARYLTVHDLMAMTALQYGHAGLEPLWPIVETALLAPDAGCVLDAPPEPLVRYRDGEACIVMFAPPAWRLRDRADQEAGAGGPAPADRRFAQFEARQRQFAAVLRAHGIPVLFAYED